MVFVYLLFVLEIVKGSIVVLYIKLGVFKVKKVIGYLNFNGFLLDEGDFDLVKWE